MDNIFSGERRLISLPEVCERMGMTRSGVNKIRARDDTFPCAVRFGCTKRARAYFSQRELEAWMEARLQGRSHVA